MENEKNELREFAELVKEMRQKQTDYFAWKGDVFAKKGILFYAKQLEGRVDKKIKEIITGEGVPGELF